MARASDLLIHAVSDVLKAALHKDYNGTVTEALQTAGLKLPTAELYAKHVAKAQKSLSELRKRVEALVDDFARHYELLATQQAPQRRDVHAKLHAAGDWLKQEAMFIALASDDLGHDAGQYTV